MEVEEGDEKFKEFGVELRSRRRQARVQTDADTFARPEKLRARSYGTLGVDAAFDWRATELVQATGAISNPTKRAVSRNAGGVRE